jgi:hypothetical protein
MTPAAFEPTNPASERPHSHAFYGAASGISKDGYRKGSMKVFFKYFATDSVIKSRVCVSISKSVNSDFIGI